MLTKIGASVLLSTLTAATFAGNALADIKTVNLDAYEQNNQVFLSQGDTLIVNLPANPGTGFGWQIARNNPGLLQPTGNTTIPNQSGLVGAPGQQSFQFLAVGAGGEELSFVYQRPGRVGSQIGNWHRLLVLVERGAQPKTVTVNEFDNRGQVTLRPGDTLVVNLPATSGTNYTWNIAQNNPALLQPLGGPRITPAGQPGGPVTQSFRFRAVGSGGEGLKLLYQNPTFGGGVEAAQRFELLVVIKRP